MKKKRTKKYPIFTYLCYLLAVAALVTSVTFSRYSVATSGSVSTQVALYNCSYEIDGFSSFAFNNTDFYIMNEDNLIGNTTARTVRFTMRNYTPMDDPTQQKATETDVNVQGSIRLRVPAELGDKLAIQLTEATAAGASSTVVTPQIVLGELLYAQVDKNNQIVTHREEVGTDSNGNKIYQDVITTTVDGKYANFSNPTTLETENFSNYEERTNNDKALDQEWTVSGTLKGDGTVYINQNDDPNTSVNESVNGLRMTITAETDKEPETYSVGFRRSAGTSLSLDLSKKMTYYTIEISLPSMLLEGGKERSRTHVAYLSLVNRLANSVYWYDLALGEITDETTNETTKKPITTDIPVDTDGNGTDDGIITGYLVNDENGRVYESGDNGTIYYVTADNLVYFDNGEDDDLSNDPIVTNMNQLVTNPPSDGERYYIKKDGQEITVLGYHFEQNTTMTVPGDNDTDTESTTIVRVNCMYANNGGYTVTLDHVAAIEEGAADYIHGITWGDKVNQLTGVTFTDNSENVTDDNNTPFASNSILYGSCSNDVKINLSTITIDPLGTVQDEKYTPNAVQMAVNRSFNLRMKAAFVQASTLP